MHVLSLNYFQVKSVYAKVPGKLEHCKYARK